MKKLSTWDMSRTLSVRNGYDTKIIPESCPANMEILMDKINELIEVINELKQ